MIGDQNSILRCISLIVLSLFIIACKSFSESQTGEKSLHCDPPLVKVEVKKALDGDTVLLDSGDRLRYAGINALELQGVDGKPEPFALKAYQRNKELTEGKTFCLEKASRERDRYGRTLGDLLLPNGTSISAILISEGLALVCYYEGSATFFERLLPVQIEALNRRIGLFSMVDKKEAKISFIGNRASKRFHHPSCSEAKRVKKKVLFKDLESALREGYCPSRECAKDLFTRD
ncbi:MAG: thermonuclease family protein [Caldimicrobium sp.]|nr:thermonuclease family protein [Caldimicrobium sp.]MDW8182431.1 thermonuclease family protein [Caldimicrobium sp.]